MIWLVPARSENMNVNVPPYLNAETTVLQDLNDTGYFQVSISAPVLRHLRLDVENKSDVSLSFLSVACISASKHPCFNGIALVCALPEIPHVVRRECWERHMTGTFLGMPLNPGPMPCTCPTTTSSMGWAHARSTRWTTTGTPTMCVPHQKINVLPACLTIALQHSNLPKFPHTESGLSFTSLSSMSTAGQDIQVIWIQGPIIY